MDVILIPGLWLDGSSWERVVPVLEQAGHRAHPLTLPGMESPGADRSRITLRDHVAAAVGAIDAIDPLAGKVALVGHSAGGAIAHAATDARPARVALVVYISGFPTADGDAIADGFPAVGGEVPLPDWSAFDDEELDGLDDDGRAELRRRAIPSPEHVTRDPQKLSDERRYDVPVTVIATEFTTAMLREWIDQGLAPVQELAKIRDVELVDLPTGHWPQFTRPDDLGRALVASLDGAALRQRPQVFAGVDDQGRPEPPLVADEAATLLGFLEFLRATIAWKTAGLDAPAFRATLAPSSMTLGGMLKHLAYVEDLWCSVRLHGRPPAAPWDTVDWEADSDWDWNSAAADTPEWLRTLWQDSVARSRALVDRALAGGGLDQPAVWVDRWYGAAPTLRWILVHLIEEYARHGGHVDLLRESIDGLAGE